MTGLAFGGLGQLWFAPFDHAEEPFPTWVEITAYTRTEIQPVTITMGAQDEMQVVEPAVLTCILDNTDSRFTFGYTGSPYGIGGGAPAIQIRYTETIGPWTFELFRGWTEYPDIPSWQPIGYQEVQLSASDRLARLARTPAFVSTLAEYIRYNGGQHLIFYFPLNETVGPSFRDLQLGFEITAQDSSPQVQASDLVSYGGAQSTIPGDDLVGLKFTGGDVSNGWVDFRGTSTTVLVVTGGDVVIAFWIKITAALGATNAGEVVELSGMTGSLLYLSVTGLTGVWLVGAQDESAGFVAAETNAAYEVDQWRLIAARLTEPGGTVDFWYHDRPAQTFTLSSSSNAGFQRLLLSGPLEAEIAHLQVYYGVGVYTRTDHLAQVAAGASGLAFQTTGQRINTILDYTGVSSTNRAIDPGQSYMSVAQLAGRTAEDMAQEATDTERGRWFADGSSRLTFHDRATILGA